MPAPPPPETRAAEVRDLIAHGKSKLAVERAKEIHKLRGDTISEELLVEAYRARIGDLLDHDMSVEARALTDLVRHRYPASSRLLEATNLRAAARDNLADFLRPLANPDLPPEQRAHIEATLRREVARLDLVAQCPSLPEDHSLRVTAAALWKAFDAVTRGPVAPDQLALAEVSRRSPLAPWKMLVLAIAAFYRREDEACRRYLEAIDPESAPARLRPGLLSLIDGRPASESAGVSHQQARLVNLIGGDSGPLCAVLQQFDKTLARTHNKGARKELLALAHQAVRGIADYAPELEQELKSRLGAKMASAAVDPERVVELIGVGLYATPRFTRMLAQAIERSPVEMATLLACQFWDRFLETAIRSGQFAPKSPECVAVWLHMAEIVEGWDPEAVDVARSVIETSAAQERMSPDLYFLDPRELYTRICDADPHPEIFRRWLTWEKKHGTPKDVDFAAGQWLLATPWAIEPLLELMDSTESRGAFKKALSYVVRAERVDPLNTEVRRARIRLLARSVIRSLKGKRPDLARQYAEEMALLDAARQGDRPALVNALRQACEDLGGGAVTEIPAGWDGPAGEMLAWNIARKTERFQLAPKLGVSYDPEALAIAVGRVSALGDDAGVPMDIPPEWFRLLERALVSKGARFEPAHLLSLGESALRRENGRIAYAASVAGLDRDPNLEARFLYLRAQSLPYSQEERRNQCLAAVIELARRHHDANLVNAAVETRQGKRPGPKNKKNEDDLDFDVRREDLTITPEHLKELLEQEHKARTYPENYAAGPRYVEKYAEERVCNCPACRAARSLDFVSPLDDEDENEDEFVEAFGAEFEKILNTKSPEKALNALGELADSLGIPLPPMPGLKKPKKRKRYYDDLPF